MNPNHLSLLQPQLSPNNNSRLTTMLPHHQYNPQSLATAGAPVNNLAIN